MRIVSWIVVVGAMAWLLYAQLNHHFAPEALDGIADETVSGAVIRPVPIAPTDETGTATAGIAYATIYPVIQAAEAAGERDRVEVVTLVRSRQPGTDPEDIVLTLDDGARNHEFAVGPDGELDLPLRPDWRAANLLVRSNQPAGSLDFQVAYLMRGLPGPEVEYAWLWESAQQVETAMAALHGAQGVERPDSGDVVAVVFEFAPGARATVRAGEGPESPVFVADEHGRVHFALTPEMLAANPTLAFSPMPRRVVPLVASDSPALDGDPG